jgi:hypothetical protein
VTARRLRLSPERRRELELLCRRAGPPSFLKRDPIPLTSRLYQDSWTRSWCFDCPAQTDAWNDGWERWLRARAVDTPDFLEPAVTTDERPSLRDWMERSAFQILAEEVLAGAPYPVALAGGRFDLCVSHVFHVCVLSWRRDTLTMSVEGSPFGPFLGDPIWTISAQREYPLDILPQTTPLLLAGAC